MKSTTGATLWMAAGLTLTGLACNEAPAEISEEPATTTVSQPVLDQGEPNWMVAGGEGLVEMIGGTDGEPDIVTGRFVLNTQEYRDAAGSADRWVLVGLGQSQPVDNDALRLRDARPILQGETANFIHAGNTGWLIGGNAGRLQTLDTEGEPTTAEAVVLQGAPVQDAAWNGNNWFVSGGGRGTTCNPGLTCPSADGQPVLNGQETVAVVTTGPPDSGSSPDWVLFSANSYQTVSPTGTLRAVVSLGNGVALTDVIYANGKIALATDDGRFALVDSTNLAGQPAWQNVLGGRAATKIEWNGTDEYLVLGVHGWAHRIATDGMPIGAAVQTATGRNLVAARFAGGRWMLGVGDIGFVEFAGSDLNPLRSLQPVFAQGQTILASAATEDGVLVAGEEGKLRFLDDEGIPLGAEITLDGTPSIRALSWNGTAFIAVGDAGFTQLLDDRGNAMGTPTTHYDGNDIRFVAWSGDFWLLGGDGGAIQRIRADGTAAGNPVAVTNIASFYDARWSGREWLVAGASTDGKAAYAVVTEDGTAGETRVLNTFNGAVLAVEWTGVEWILGGTAGKIQRINAEGAPVAIPFDALAPYDITEIYFNTENYLVGGEFGAIRRLSQALTPLRLPIASIDQKPVGAIIWTRPRGYASGLCISGELCFDGPCVGELAGGTCCDSACDRPCESCFARDTNATDGVCSPVVADKQPPNGVGCERQSTETCGFTGACDGAGDCQFYGLETECDSALCVSGDYTPSSACDGSGACDIASSASCAPYNSCTLAGCTTSCGSDSDCVAGYFCQDSICIEIDDTKPDGPSDEGDEDGGCCSTVRPGHTSNSVWLIALCALLGLLWSRRSYGK